MKVVEAGLAAVGPVLLLPASANASTLSSGSGSFTTAGEVISVRQADGSTIVTATGFRGLSAREKWGYGVWLFVGLVFGVPESWAGITSPPWPALSDTIGHLESTWAPTAVIVVALLVFVGFGVIRHPLAQAAGVAMQERERGQQRTANGRLTRRGAYAISHVSVFAYFLFALCAVVGGSLIAATVSSDMYVLGYFIYGLFAIFLVIIPNIMALWFAGEVPFPTLARTVADLERRWRPTAMIIVAGLIILMIHLAFAPWPDIFGHVGVARAHP